MRAFRTLEPTREPRVPRFVPCLLGVLAFGLSLPEIALAGEASAGEESGFLGRVRRLTYAGRRAGEGYFSADGKKLVFQSERDADNPFYQIWVIDLEDGATRRVSPGTGKTTCAFFHPRTGDVLFASTHHDPASPELQRQELEARKAGRERRYAWDYDPEMELYVERRATRALERLTRVRGYDAEGSYAPDGRSIVFTSTREAYARELAEDERRRLEVDPSWFADLWIMPADGGEARRLTTTPGYDGGPFFTADGSRIVWRRFDEEGVIADVWTMRTDGSDARAITDFASMSWAPYPHPSGEYVIFTSNKLGFENFELFLVDLAGTKQPVRVTFSDGFDGLPVFSPDGRTLAWTSTRNDVGRGGQIFVAPWNHERAGEALRAAPAREPRPRESGR